MICEGRERFLKNKVANTNIKNAKCYARDVFNLKSSQIAPVTDEIHKMSLKIRENIHRIVKSGHFWNIFDEKT